MGLEKNILTENGIECNYHRIIRFEGNVNADTLSIEIASYVNKEHRETYSAIQTEWWDIPIGKGLIKIESNLLSELYTVIKQDNQKYNASIDIFEEGQTE